MGVRRGTQRSSGADPSGGGVGEPGACVAEWPGACAQGGLGLGLRKGSLPGGITGHLGHLGALLGLSKHHWPSRHSRGASWLGALCALCISAREEGPLWSSTRLQMLRVKWTGAGSEKG